ncbi:hypothetical protein DNTS_027576, partial [Danionella cerebrum]
MMMMMSLAVVLNLLFLVSSVSAGHHYGGSVTFSPKGTNADGSMRVEFRFKRTYDWCSYSYWYCSSGNCGSESNTEHGTIDSSLNGRSGYTNSWCQAETVVIRNIFGNTPFDLIHMWIWAYDQTPINPTVHRVPKNCPRTYRLIAFDPDKDQVKCRYGTQQSVECDRCDQPQGFSLN